MIIGVCTIDLYLHGSFSLKEKRGRLKPLLNQLRQRFEVAAAEVAEHDSWQTAHIAIAVISTDASHVYSVLENAVHWIENEYRAVEVTDWQIELR